MPSGKATKPGDIVIAKNGLSIEVDNTDAEGRLVLADALTYVSETYSPHTLIDVATLTGACVIALGDVYSAAFTESDSLWKELKAAGEAESDPFWRMPLDDAFLRQISSSNADLCNTGGRPAGSATAAIFLKQFVVGLEERGAAEPKIRYSHLDIAGSMVSCMNAVSQPRNETHSLTIATFLYFSCVVSGGDRYHCQRVPGQGPHWPTGACAR